MKITLNQKTLWLRNPNGYVVFEAYDCSQAQKVLDSHHPNLMLLDLMLPDRSGEEFCKLVRKQSWIPIAMLTTKEEESDILRGLDIGADDYIKKPFSVQQMMARVRALLRRSGEEAIPLANLMSFNDQDMIIEPQKREVSKRGEQVYLTPDEFKILMTLLVSHPHKIFSWDELIVSALGVDFEGFDWTVDSHIKNIRQKIETDTKEPKYILTVHGVGHRFDGE